MLVTKSVLLSATGIRTVSPPGVVPISDPRLIALNPPKPVDGEKNAPSVGVGPVGCGSLVVPSSGG